MSWNTNVRRPWFELCLGESELVATPEREHRVFSVGGASLAGDSLRFFSSRVKDQPLQLSSSLKLAAFSVACLYPACNCSVPSSSCDFTLRHSLIYWFSFFTSFLYIHSFLFICLKLIATVMNESKTKLGIATECGHFLKCDIPPPEKSISKCWAALQIRSFSQPGFRRPSLGVKYLWTKRRKEKKKRKKNETAMPLQAWTGREGSRRLRFPDFKTIGTWRW